MARKELKQRSVRGRGAALSVLCTECLYEKQFLQAHEPHLSSKPV